MRERGAPVEEIARTLSDIVPVDKMDIRQRGYLREMHASLLYRLDDDGDFCAIVEMLRLALDQDPDDWLVASRYISLVGKKRRCERRFETTLSDVEEIAQILQRFKDVDMPVLFSTNLKFYELEVLYEYLQSSKGPVPRHLTDYKDDLCEELLQVVKGGKLAQCAFIYSRNPKNRRQACEFVELALTQTESTYALAKAANVFWVANKLERALECATRASEEAIGSCWQVLELKVALGHSFDAEQFFQDLFKRFPKASLEIHLNAFDYYVSNTDDFSTALGHYLEILEQTGGGELPARLEHGYWAWSRKRDCNTVELAYRIARYFLDEDRGQQLSEEGLASGRVIVSIVDSMPDVKSRFSATRSDNLDAIIYQLSGYSR
ncbi:unnamed protein product [Nesidiocoris tenuis]|uniref:Uncharacterized protein n=1 Tax=Nesidiocoris tenuis TaxID=355587 RepID=A0A6H5GS60_9HEMI|nr:unnamed protein product [Nesidiocoris tenuis]